MATVTCDADTYVHSLNTTSNYGSSWTMQCYGSPQVVPMMKFTLPSGTPTAATLTLWTDNDASTGTYDVRVISDVSWDEATVTWASGKPSFNGPSIGQVTPSATVTEYEITLDAATLASYMGSQVTIYLDGSSTNGCKFRSTENGTSAHHPVMDITTGGSGRTGTAAVNLLVPVVAAAGIGQGQPSNLIDGVRYVRGLYDGTRKITRLYDGDTLLWEAPEGDVYGAAAVTLPLPVVAAAGAVTDPGSATTVNCDADTYVHASNPDTNYGGATTMQCYGGTPQVVPLLRFTLPTPVIGATLNLTTDSNPSGDTLTVYAQAGGTWEEGVVTYNTAPTLSGSQVGTVVPSTADTTYPIVLTASVMDDYQGTTVTLYILGQSQDGALFRSRQHGTVATRPTLVVATQADRSGTSAVTLPVPTVAASGGTTGGETEVDCDADTYIHQSNPTSNYGSASTMQCYGTPIVTPLMRFTMPATVTAATLNITTDSNESGDTLTVYAQAGGTWDETSVTYNTAPTLSGTQVATFVPSSQDTTYSVPLTASVMDDYQGTTVTLYIIGASGDGALFRSRQHATSSTRPTLTVET